VDSRQAGLAQKPAAPLLEMAVGRPPQGAIKAKRDRKDRDSRRRLTLKYIM
jgi:hypothetical protein